MRLDSANISLNPFELTTLTKAIQRVLGLE